MRHLRGMLATLAALIGLVAGAPSAAAAEYAFAVPTVLLETWLEPDGSATLEYTFTFENAPGAKPLDGVDVGMPTKSWSLKKASASKDGKPLPVEKSPYVANAVAANLPTPIPPGQSGQVRVRVEGVGGLLFKDTSQPGFVSVRLTPTWFGKEFVRGESFVRVVLHAPPGVDVTTLKWHAVPWTGQASVEATPARPEHAAVIWERTYPFTAAWELGMSFPLEAAPAAMTVPSPARGASDTAKPKRPSPPVVTGVQEVTTWGLFHAWAGSEGVHAGALLVFLVAFTLVFFWATRRTGCVVWGVLGVMLAVACACVPVLPWLLAPPLVGAAFLVAGWRRRHRKPYAPAVASVEGGGIKRGLTAPEAASLLEAPPEKILLLVLYGIARKGLAQVTTAEDKRLLARAAEGFGGNPPADLKLAAEKGVVLHAYESPFLALLRGKKELDVATLDWRRPLRVLAEHAASRLAGYDLDQTRDYYRRIVERAWKEAAGLGDVTLRKEAVDRTFDWLVLDPNAWKRMDGWHRAGWDYENPWLGGGARSPGRAAAGAGAAGAATASAPPSSPSSAPPPLPGAPKASDVAGSLGGRLEALSGGLAAKLGLSSAPQGVFASVDKVGSEAFSALVKEMSKPSSGGGGGGFSCACACAGCACACACAGGGR